MVAHLECDPRRQRAAAVGAEDAQVDCAVAVGSSDTHHARRGKGRGDARFPIDEIVVSRPVVERYQWFGYACDVRAQIHRDGAAVVEDGQTKANRPQGEHRRRRWRGFGEGEVEHVARAGSAILAKCACSSSKRRSAPSAQARVSLPTVKAAPLFVRMPRCATSRPPGPRCGRRLAPAARRSIRAPTSLEPCRGPSTPRSSNESSTSQIAGVSSQTVAFKRPLLSIVSDDQPAARVPNAVRFYQVRLEWRYVHNRLQLSDEQANGAL